MSDVPQLLISVRNVREAGIAMDARADWIDVKEPSRGPMGMADAATIDAICHLAQVRGLAGRVTAALGEAIDWDHRPEVPTRLRYAKMGLARLGGRWAHVLLDHMPNVPFIVTVYADHQLVGAPAPATVVDALTDDPQYQGAGVGGVLIDTAVKDGRNLFDWLAPDQVRQLVDQVTRCDGLIVALAGSLTGESFERAAALAPHVLAVRGAACSGNDRSQRIDGSRIMALRQVIAAGGSRAVSPAG